MSECPFHNPNPLLDLDSFSAGTPRAAIRELREQHRIVWEDDDFATGGHWLLLQQADIDYVLKTPELFSNNFGPLLEDLPPDLLPEQQQSMTFMDPPRHRRYRSMVDYAFRPKAIAAREATMREQARDIIDAVIERGQCEFVTEVAQELPMRVMFTLLGVRPEDYQYVVDLTNALSLADDPEYAENRAAGFKASMELLEFGTALAADHRRNPRDSMTQEVLESDFDGQRLNDREYGRFFTNLIVGGVETTRNTLAWAMYEFIRHPEQYQLLQQQPELAADAVEEILRLRNTVSYLRRTATRDTELAGQTIKAGDKVVCVLGAPNHDPQFFSEPERFDITRPQRESVRRHYRTFGAGPHFCVGVHQARLNLVVMIEEIATRMSDLRLLEEPSHARSVFMDGFKRMPIAFSARTA